MINKRINNGIRKIPNQTITNLLYIELNDDKIAVLKPGLNHGLLIRPKENEMTAVMEDIYGQIVCQYLLKKDDIWKHSVETALKSFTYSYLDLDFKNVRVDQRGINVLRFLKERCMLLKPHKGQGIVVVNKKYYYNSLDQLFNDLKKNLKSLPIIQHYVIFQHFKDTWTH